MSFITNTFTSKVFSGCGNKSCVRAGVRKLESVFTKHSQEDSFLFLQDFVNLNVTQLLIG